MMKPNTLTNARLRPWLMVAVALLVLAILFVSGHTVSADSVLPPVTDQGCLQDLYSKAGCTAEDVRIAGVQSFTVLDDGCAFPGDTVQFQATYQVVLTTQDRYDIGLFFATDGDPNGDGALTGQCTIATLPYAPVPPWVNLDLIDQPTDTCGDIGNGTSALYPVYTITAKCVDSGNNTLLLPNCTSWKQPGDNGLCTSPTQALPGAPSKCKCDTGFSIPIIVPEPAYIEVIKSLNPPTDTGLFNLQIDGESKVTNVGNGGTTGKVTVGAGTNVAPGATHTVGETAGTNTTLANYTSSISCVKRGTTTVVASGSGAGPLNVSVMPNDDIVCTITNSGAKITIIKAAYNLSDQWYCPDRIFGFSLTSYPGFTLSSNFCPPARTSSVTKVAVPNTTYTIAETDGDINDTSIPPTGWDLFNVTCTGGIGSGFVWTPGSVSVSGQVAPGGEVVCTFKNRQRSDLAVDLTRFDAAWSGKSVLVTWQTNSEIGNLGFNLSRQSGNGPEVKLNSGLILSKSSGGTEGALYTWTDKTVKPGRTYQYFLDDVAEDGTVTRHGPIVPAGQMRK